MVMPTLTRYEDRPECPTCGLKMAYFPPGWWKCIFHGAAWIQHVAAWWHQTPIVMDRDLGLTLVARRFGTGKAAR